ncbi:MAG: Omp28-related outer membrane protein [Salinivirgaceae bacterium]|nr:Omp28-related outer membrane protein [Salinivirgaceae bacterium]
MRKIYILAIALLYAAMSFGQLTLPYEENFDTFMADAKFVNQVTTTEWTTWSDAPNTAEDPIVSAAYSVSSPNSIKIASGNDLVFKTGNIVSGRYLVSFNMYMPAGKLGYYNMLQDFAGTNSAWAYQIMFDGGTATAQGVGEVTFSYETDTWFELRTIVDLDSDWCEIYKDGELVFEFQWSVGTSQTNIKQFAAVNFFAWDNDGAGSPEYYFDDLNVKTIVSPEAPTNLVGTLENINDVVLTWAAPADVTPESYSIYRNGISIASEITVLTYTDVNVYPGSNEYAVRAFYGEAGLSTSAITTVVIEGGVARKTTLFEVATGTWCQYCPGAARGVDKLVEEGKDVSIIEYHGGDDYETAESGTRIDYYGITSYPTAVVDGKIKIGGGSVTGTMYDSYLGAYENSIDIPAVVDMNMTVIRTSETDYTATITTTEEFTYFTEGLKLRVALTESNIEESWQGMSELNFLMRDMIEGAAGLDIDFSEVTSHEFVINFELASSFVRENCEVVAFVQHDGTQTIAQAVNDTLPSVITSIKYNKNALNASLYPNPVANELFVNGVENADKIEIVSISGQVIYSGSEISLFKNGFNTSELASGMYSVIIYKGNEASVLRFVK